MNHVEASLVFRANHQSPVETSLGIFSVRLESVLASGSRNSERKAKLVITVGCC